MREFIIIIDYDEIDFHMTVNEDGWVLVITVGHSRIIPDANRQPFHPPREMLAVLTEETVQEGLRTYIDGIQGVEGNTERILALAMEGFRQVQGGNGPPNDQ